jgi:uncharacterized protein (TIGR00661 family)
VKNIGKNKILIAPLDWGLGHATRCIPLIRQLLAKKHEVIIAAGGAIKVLLEQEFPAIKILPLKGYRIQYSKTRWGIFFVIISQVPKVLYSIFSEKRWLDRTIETNKIDIVISDNRFGLFNKKVYSIFITHQLFIQSPLLQSWLQKINYYFINKFDECWVPDFKNPPNLAGKLSHPLKLPSTPIKYIGSLSRFEANEIKEEKHLLILLSGPEPQRTILENIIIAQLKNFFEPVLLVRGLPGNSNSIEVGQNVKHINHIPSEELEEAILSASFVIARSGYSTIMDLTKLKKKAILIPTPGQTEQEYLAKHLFQQQLIFSIEQQKFNLEKALKEASIFPYKFYDWGTRSALKKTILLDNLLKLTL